MVGCLITTTLTKNILVLENKLMKLQWWKNIYFEGKQSSLLSMKIVILIVPPAFSILHFSKSSQPVVFASFGIILSNLLTLHLYRLVTFHLISCFSGRKIVTNCLQYYGLLYSPLLLTDCLCSWFWCWWRWRKNFCAITKNYSCLKQNKTLVTSWNVKF